MSAEAAPAAPALLLVGCGKMGGALLKGWLERSLAQRLVVVEPGPGAAGFAGKPGVEVLATAEAVAADLVPASSCWR